ncbi:MAG TPA: hypothetical protein VIK72_16960 [Clostridiaceae bacterium]
MKFCFYGNTALYGKTAIFTSVFDKYDNQPLEVACSKGSRGCSFNFYYFGFLNIATLKKFWFYGVVG